MKQTTDGTTRREMLGAALALAGAPAPRDWSDLVARNDRAIEQLLPTQFTDRTSPHCGGFPSGFGLVMSHATSNILPAFTAGLLNKQSKFYGSSMLAERIRLGIGHMRHMQREDGYLDLLTTNFDSPPDTAFISNNAATIGILLRRAGERELFAALEPFLRKAGAGLTIGGVHTPNHRWVVCSALAQLYELFGEPGYLRRIDQWLAEGIDIDPDGQYTERSPVAYNGITNRSLTITALKLKRPELLEPVRRNLDAMLHLLHSNFEVATEFSHRQDHYTRGTMTHHWLAVRNLAIVDQNGQLATLSRYLDSVAASLANVMEYPELSNPMPAEKPLPDSYERLYPHVGIVRYRAGKSSATFLSDNDVVFSLHHGDTAITSVSFSAAYFGRGHFHGSKLEKVGRGYQTTQSLDWGYWQPFTPVRKIPAGIWDKVRPERPRTQECFLDQSATLEQTPRGFRLRIRSGRTEPVPVTIRIGVSKDAKVEGCSPAPDGGKGLFLKSGYATITEGRDRIRVGPGLYRHWMTSMIKLPEAVADSAIYITGTTPFDHTLDFEVG